MAARMNESSSNSTLQPAAEIVAAQQEIVDTFKVFDDWTERYQYIIELGEKLPPMPPALKGRTSR